MKTSENGKRICEEIELPKCVCGKLARPAVLMFDDRYWLDQEFEYQLNNYNKWLNKANNICIIEIGAGKAIPTVRMESHKIAMMMDKNVSLIRINLEQSGIPKRIQKQVSISMGGLDALKLIDKDLNT